MAQNQSIALLLGVKREKSNFNSSVESLHNSIAHVKDYLIELDD